MQTANWPDHDHRAYFIARRVFLSRSNIAYLNLLLFKPCLFNQVSLPDSVIETSRPVKLKDFAEHYRIMSADSDFRFSEEFEELKHVGRDQPCSAADLPVNRPKNR